MMRIKAILPFVFVLLYVFFLYTAQNTLIPPYVHSVIMYTMLIIVAIYCIIYKKLKLQAYTVWYLFLLLYSVISALLTVDTDWNTVYQMIICFLITFCFITVLDNVNKIVLIVKTFVWSSIVMGLMILVVNGISSFSLLATLDADGRLGSEITGNANSFTALFMYSGVFSAWLSIYSNVIYKRVLYLILLVFQLVIMALSGGRKTIIAVTLCFILGYLAYGKGWKVKLRNILFASLSIGVLIYTIMNVPFLYDSVGERFSGLISMMMGNGSSVSSDDTRKMMIEIGLNKWYEAPVFGHGFDSFKYFNLYATGHFYYSHNNYVEILYDLGIIGFAVYYSIFVWLSNKFKIMYSSNKAFSILGYMILLELLVFDIGGISYYTIGNMIILSIASLLPISLKENYIPID